MGSLTINKVLASQLVYTKADLEVLKSGKNYVEFFRHAKDIIPTQRDQSWLNMVSTMASDLVDQYRSQDKYKQSEFKLIESLANWPELANDEFFQVKRNSYALTYFKRCLLREDKNSCYDQMKSFWKTARQDPETGYQLLVLAEGFFPSKNSWVFIKKALTSEFSKFYCPKEVVQHTIEKRLRRFSTVDSGSQQFPVKLKLLANSQCWAKTKEYFGNKLLEASAAEQEVIFRALEGLDLITKEEKYAYLTKYFLEGPKPGSLLNFAWSHLEKLSQDYGLRKKVLEKLIELDPLPGAIFTKESKNQVFTRHLVKTFPEYLNSYTKTCVSYLSGTKTFPYGNPTLNCHYLFKINEKEVLGEQVISQPLRIRYSGLMKNSLD
jgi:hypothetical protein